MKKASPRPRTARASRRKKTPRCQKHRSHRPVPSGPRPPGSAPPVLGPMHLALLPDAYAVEMCRRLGDVLRARRLEIRVTLYELEMRCGVAREMIARFESAECIPGWYNLARIVQALRLDWVELGRRLMAKPATMSSNSERAAD